MRIVVCHVPAGSGHTRAAEAVAAALKSVPGSHEVILLDALEQVTPFFRWTYTQGYIHLIQSAPFLWGGIYYSSDSGCCAGPIRGFYRLSNRLQAKGFEQRLIQLNPDIIAGTHFFPMDTAALLKQRGKIASKLVTVITDYLPHSFWIAPGIDLYTIGSQEGKADLLKRGVEENRIHLFGIPIDLKFGYKQDRAMLAKKLGLDPNLFTVLIGSGGTGTGPVDELVSALQKIHHPIQILAVTGTNKHLFQRLEEHRHRISHPMKIYGFVENMEELMDVSDVIITKPGGLTCAEALTKGLPLILVAPIPGQETRNAKYLERQGVASLIERIHQIPLVIQQLQEDPEKRRLMKEKAVHFSRQDAALKIAQLVVAP